MHSSKRNLRKHGISPIELPVERRLTSFSEPSTKVPFAVAKLFFFFFNQTHIFSANWVFLGLTDLVMVPENQRVQFNAATGPTENCVHLPPWLQSMFRMVGVNRDDPCKIEESRHDEASTVSCDRKSISRRGPSFPSADENFFRVRHILCNLWIWQEGTEKTKSQSKIWLWVERCWWE